VTRSTTVPLAAVEPRVGVVGCGQWGRNLVRNFSELRALAAVCDTNPGQAESMARQYGAAAVSWDEMLADTALNSIVVAAPAAAHAALARQALRAGKHVLVEKPLALDVADADELCALAADKGRVLMVGHLLQYHPAFTKLKEMVTSGLLGRLNYVYSNRLNLGRFRREEDILWSFAPHDISMILALIGQEPAKVSAVGSYYLHPTIADITTTHLTFPGGEQAHVFVSWLHPFKEQKIIVIGDRAMAVFDDGEPWERKLVLYRHTVEWRDAAPTPVKAEGEPVPLQPGEPLRGECQHFLECVANGRQPRTDGREGARVLSVLQQASASLTGASALAALAPKAMTAPQAGVFVHESAYVDEPATLGEGTKIWHFSHVLPRTTIGRNCVVGQNVAIGPDVTVGDRCKIQNNVSIYKGVVLEDGVFCGPSCVFTNVLNPRAEIERKAEFKPTRVCTGATIGANATIVCGTTIGRYALIGAGAVVTRDVPDFAVMVGNPARRIAWVSRAGERLGPDLVCPRTGERYQLTSEGRLESVSPAAAVGGR
jgi:UDP-2-acetamido-3-amino-2,3-dideoxy-glucuronate N-acetyltransferase